MGEGFKRKVGKAFRHRADAVCEAQFKENSLFSGQPAVRRTHYRFRLADPGFPVGVGQPLVLADQGGSGVGVWLGNQCIGELDAASGDELRRAFADDPLACRAVAARIESAPSLGGYCQATVEAEP